jgi:hypothetical protein
MRTLRDSHGGSFAGLDYNYIQRDERLTRECRARWGNDCEVILTRADGCGSKVVRFDPLWDSAMGREEAFNFFRARIAEAERELLSDRPPEILRIPTPPVLSNKVDKHTPD